MDVTLYEIKECLESSEVPAKSPDCDFCNYRESAGAALMQAVGKGGEKAAPAAFCPKLQLDVN
jgi:hypothetical protein